MGQPTHVYIQYVNSVSGDDSDVNDDIDPELLEAIAASLHEKSDPPDNRSVNDFMSGLEAENLADDVEDPVKITIQPKTYFPVR